MGNGTCPSMGGTYQPPSSPAPPPSHPALSQTCNTFHNVTNGLTILVDPGTDVCFLCPVSNPQWTISGTLVDPAIGEVENGVLRIFDAAEVFSTTSAITLSCSSSPFVFAVMFLRGNPTTQRTESCYQPLPPSLPTVFIPPDVTGVTTVNESDTLSLMCDNSVSFPPPTISWLGPNGTDISGESTLTVEGIQRDQAGNYTCLLTNTVNGTLSDTVVVTVQCKCVCVSVCV